MLRMLIALALIGAAVWFYLKDGREQQAAGEQQKQLIDNAQAVREATEKAAASAAQQTDALRDQALGRPPAE
ncbi:MAG: hypothetical protein ACOY33_06125 [Pseudomonadota bacterium]